MVRNYGERSQYFEMSSKNTLLNSGFPVCGLGDAAAHLLRALEGWTSVPFRKGESIFALLFLSLVIYCSSIFFSSTHPSRVLHSTALCLIPDVKGVYPWAPPSYKRFTCTLPFLTAPGRSSAGVGIGKMGASQGLPMEMRFDLGGFRGKPHFL